MAEGRWINTIEQGKETNVQFRFFFNMLIILVMSR